MDFLSDPNIAYLILLGGIFLGLLALVTPGTGVPELGAAFCFLLAGYAVYNLAINWWTINWWALVILFLSSIPFTYAVKRRSKIFLGVSIFLLVIGSVFLFTREGEWMSVNPIVAFLASGALAVFCWVMVVKFFEMLETQPAHDLRALIGLVGEARTAIRSEGDGSVQVNGELWSARSEKEIASGSYVRVIRREKFMLVVEKVE